MTVTLIRAAIIYFFVIAGVRIMGKRQIGELKPHELVITILVSQIASMPLEENSMPLANFILPLLLLISLEIIVSVISMKSLHFRNLIQGKPVFVIRNGKLNQKQLKRLRYTVDDLVDAIRQKDCFDLSEVQDAVIETNGTVSVLPKKENQPLTPKDVEIKTKDDGMPITIVMDGKPVTEYFGAEQFSNSEINLIIKSNNLQTEKLLLLTVDNNGNIFYIPKENTK